MRTGNVRRVRSIGAKFADMPKFATRYCGVYGLTSEFDFEKGVTIGSCDTGRPDIWTLGSGPIPGPLNVQEILLSEIQVIYFTL